MTSQSPRFRRHRLQSVVSLWVAAAALLGACGSGDAGSSASESTDVVLGEELVGRWAHYDVVAYEEAPMKTLIVSYGFTDFAVQDGELVESDSFCHADQVSNQDIETSISDEATRAIVPVSTPVEVSEADGVLRVQRPATPTPVGIRLDDPANDPLPSDPADPRIVDDDEDGNPGITVHVKGGSDFEGDLFLARREIFAYDLTADGPDLLTGTVADDSEQLVIGATNPLLSSTKAQWAQHSDPSRSPIVLRRVDAGYDCDQLMAERRTLFPPDPSPDW